jgi:TPR repeat protein
MPDHGKKKAIRSGEFPSWRGQGAARSVAGAAEWYRRAADAGSLTGMLHAAGMAEPPEALALHRRAAQAGLQAAELGAARLAEAGELELARHYLELAHYAGVPEATVDLARLCLEGRGRAAGMAALERGKGGSRAMAHYFERVITLEGRYGIRRDPRAAFWIFQDAARCGAPEAVLRLGEIKLEGGRALRDEAQKEATLAAPAGFFKTAAGEGGGGSGVAQNKYGEMLMAGEGVPRDCALARQYFLWAANNGEMRAYVGLAEIVIGLDGTPPDRDRAIEFLQKGRDGGSAEAAERLAALGA